MNITTDKPYTIFRKEYKNSVFYKVGISKKTQEGMYENGYIDIRFKGNPSIPNKTPIYIKNAFLTFYLSKDKHTVPYIVVMEWEEVSEVIDKEHKDVVKQDTEDTHKDLGTSITLDELEIDEDLPF